MDYQDEDEEFLYGDAPAAPKPSAPKDAAAPSSAASEAASTPAYQTATEEDSESEESVDFLMDNDGSLPPNLQPVDASELGVGSSRPKKEPSPSEQPEDLEQLRQLASGTTDDMAVDDQASASTTPTSTAGSKGVPFQTLESNQAPELANKNLADLPVDAEPNVNVYEVPNLPYTEETMFDLDVDDIPWKPWRKPNANPSDYFNYGMNEASWRTYIERQKEMRGLNHRDVNPFSVFAHRPVGEAWEELDPKYKAVLMAVIMAYRPGVALENQPPPVVSKGTVELMQTNSANEALSQSFPPQDENADKRRAPPRGPLPKRGGPPPRRGR